MSSRGGTPRRAGAVAVVLLLGVLCSACVGDPAPYAPTGVDELVIPTPSPDPDDFVAKVDNPWFPVEPGTRWTYRRPDGPSGEIRVVATAGPTVAGVRTSALRTTQAGGSTTDFFAQDAAGNVWWFGRAGQWRIGPGVAAGLMMPAHPRRGDGYVMADAAGFGVRGVVVDTGRTWDSDLGRSRRAVVLEMISGGIARVESFVPHIGLVQRGEAGVVSFDQPRP